MGLLKVAVAIALVAIAALPATADAAKKKGKNRTRVVDITMPVNAPIPDATPANGPNGLLTSAIQVGGKQLKGKRIRDVNVTVQTTGLTGTVPTNDLVGYLTAPNGATTGLFSRLGLIGSGFSIGPLTLDDESTIGLGFGDTGDPTSLEDPWIGTARPDEPGLYVTDDGPASGTWTLHVLDTFAGETSRFDLWRLVVVAGPPYKTK
jgi:subtilisin-like proprotein convertase family protein